MMSLFAILPLVACALVIVVAKRSAVIGAGAGLAVALLLIAWNESLSLSVTSATSALLDATILTLSAAIVILPGIYFNAIIRGHGTVGAIQQWIECLPYTRERKTLLLLFGLLPAVESLTGFGVSLFLSIPILFHLFSPPVAFRLSMLGMNIMPWGTLALATVVGATLSEVSVHALGWYTALTSSLVFPLLSLVALYVIGGLQAVKNNLYTALGLSAGLSATLLLLNHFQLVEIAGVIAGLVVCIAGALLLPKETSTVAPPDKWQVLRIFLPYGGVLLLITLERLVPSIYKFLSDALVLSGSTTSLKVLTSPGVALLLIAVALYLSRPIALPHKTLLIRARTFCLSLFTFVVLAQIMRQSSMIAVFGSALAKWNGDLLLLFSPLIGMTSGFITGSNLSGNALTMAVQSSIGAYQGTVVSFAAAQNSGAGHAIFTSMPIIVLILTLAKDVIPQTSTEASTQEHHLLKFGLRVSFFILLALTLTTWVIHLFTS